MAFRIIVIQGHLSRGLGMEGMTGLTLVYYLAYR